MLGEQRFEAHFSPLAIKGIKGIMAFMSSREYLAVDARGRISVQKLGFAHSSTIIAERLPDGGVVLRQGTVLTDAEIDFLSNPKALEGLRRGLDDAAAGRVQPAQRTRRRQTA